MRVSWTDRESTLDREGKRLLKINTSKNLASSKPLSRVRKMEIEFQ